MKKDHYQILGVNIWDNPKLYKEKFNDKITKLDKVFEENKNILNNLIIDLFLAIKYNNYNLFQNINDKLYNLVKIRFVFKNKNDLETNINNFRIYCEYKLLKEAKEKHENIRLSYSILSNSDKKEKYDSTYKKQLPINIINEIRNDFKEILLILSENNNYSKLSPRTTATEIDFIENTFNSINLKLKRIKETDENEFLRIYDNIYFFLNNLYSEIYDINITSYKEKISYRHTINVSIVRLLFFLHVSNYDDGYINQIKKILIDKIDNVDLLNNINKKTLIKEKRNTKTKGR